MGCSGYCGTYIDSSMLMVVVSLVDVLVMMVAVGSTVGVEFMLLGGWMLRHVHHV